MTPIIVRSDTLCAAFSPENGALIGLEAPGTGWVIHRRPELGLSWRLLVPLGEDKRNNPVYGEKQALTECRAEDDGATFVWDGVTSERGGRLDIRVEVRVRAVDKRLEWRTTINNASPYCVENVYSPYIGDLSRPAGAQWFKTFLYCYATAQEWSLDPRYDMHEGDHSVDYPTQFSNASMAVGAPTAPFFLLRDGMQGLYMGVMDDSGELVAWHTELRPGYDSAIDSRAPDADDIAGKPVHTLCAAVHVCFIAPGEERALTPVALQAFTGGWQAGVDIYRAWRDGWSRPAKGPAWADEPHSWLQLHINSPEDELRLPFVRLPEVAAECAKYGVKAIQLVGWNDGGQDQGNPSHSPDPRLGTWDELKAAIAACQALGVKIILFAKFTWADRATAWFRQELIRCAIKDPYGDPYVHQGYEYQTATQLLDINTKRFSPMCFGDEAYLKVCGAEFEKLRDLGADGMLFDECLHHTPALLCFDTTHNHRYGWPVYKNDRLFVERLRKTEGLRPDFLFSGEACYDWELDEYTLSYFRSRDKGHIALSRYMRPKAQLMTAISGFNDRNMIDQCLMCRYIMSYEPYNFKGWLHDYPDTVAYGQKMDALRTQLRKWLWDGEYRDTCGAQVLTEDGRAHPTFSRFEADDGTSALVICNYEDAPLRVTARLDKGTLARYRTVDEDVWHPAAGGIAIPARSAVVVTA